MEVSNNITFFSSYKRCGLLGILPPKSWEGSSAMPPSSSTSSLPVGKVALNRGGGKMVIRQTDVLRNRSARTVVDPTDVT